MNVRSGRLFIKTCGTFLLNTFLFRCILSPWFAFLLDGSNFCHVALVSLNRVPLGLIILEDFFEVVEVGLTRLLRFI